MLGGQILSRGLRVTRLMVCVTAASSLVLGGVWAYSSTGPADIVQILKTRGQESSQKTIQGLVHAIKNMKPSDISFTNIRRIDHSNYFLANAIDNNGRGVARVVCSFDQAGRVNNVYGGAKNNTSLIDLDSRQARRFRALEGLRKRAAEIGRAGKGGLEDAPEVRGIMIMNGKTTEDLFSTVLSSREREVLSHLLSSGLAGPWGISPDLIQVARKGVRGSLDGATGAFFLALDADTGIMREVISGVFYYMHLVEVKVHSLRNDGRGGEISPADRDIVERLNRIRRHFMSGPNHLSVMRQVIKQRNYLIANFKRLLKNDFEALIGEAAGRIFAVIVSNESDGAIPVTGRDVELFLGLGLLPPGFEYDHALPDVEIPERFVMDSIRDVSREALKKEGADEAPPLSTRELPEIQRVLTELEAPRPLMPSFRLNIVRLNTLAPAGGALESLTSEDMAFIRDILRTSGFDDLRDRLISVGPDPLRGLADEFLRGIRIFVVDPAEVEPEKRR